MPAVLGRWHCTELLHHFQHIAPVQCSVILPSSHRQDVHDVEADFLAGGWDAMNGPPWVPRNVLCVSAFWSSAICWRIVK